MSDFVKFEILSDGSSLTVEKSFARTSCIRDLKMKLELLTGKLSDGMKIALLSDDKCLVDDMGSDDSRSLSSYLPDTWDKLVLRVSGPDLNAGDDISDAVPKFELSDEAYEQRSESLRKFKMEQKLGRFDPNRNVSPQKELQEQEHDIRQRLAVGNRCQVQVDGAPTRIGTVMFIGATNFKPGIWIGVKYDEPVGKNDGSVSGHRYFECQDKYGSFVKPEHVTAGHFPEEDPFAE